MLRTKMFLLNMRNDNSDCRSGFGWSLTYSDVGLNYAKPSRK